MADNENTAPVAPIAPATIAIPAEKQDMLRSLDGTAAGIQRELGAATIRYDLQKAGLEKQFESNRQSYNNLLTEIAKSLGVNLNDQSQEWGFNFEKMAFIRQK